MRFGIFYEHQLPRPWDDGAEQQLHRTTRSTRSSSPTELGFDYVWEVEHHFLEEYSHSCASEVFLAAASQRTKRHPPRLRDRRRCRPATSIPRAWPRRWRRSTSSRGGRVEFGTGETSSGAELGGFGVDRETKREQWERGARRRHAHDGRGAVRRLRRALRHDAAAQRRPQAGAEAAPAAVGRVLAARDDPARRREGHRRADRSRSSSPRRRRSGSTSTTRSSPRSAACPAGFAVNPNVAVVLPMMCAPDEADGDRARHRRRALLRLLARALLRLRRAPPGAHEHLGGVPSSAATRSASRARSSPPTRRRSACSILQQGLGSLRGAIGTPEQIRDLCRALRGGRRRPAHLRLAGGPEPPRAHLRVARAVRRRGHARVRRARATRPTRARSRALRAARSRRRSRAASRRATADPDYVDRADRLRSAGAPRRRDARPSRRPRAAGRGRRRRWRDQRRARVRGLRAALRRPPPRAHGRLRPRPARALRRDGARASGPTRRPGFSGEIQYDLARPTAPRSRGGELGPSARASAGPGRATTRR